MTRNRKPKTNRKQVEELREQEAICKSLLVSYRFFLSDYSRRRNIALTALTNAQAELDLLDDRFAAMPDKISDTERNLRIVRSQLNVMVTAPRTSKIAALTAELNRLLAEEAAERAKNH